MIKTNNEEGNTQYQGPLTLLERQIIATKTQIALDHENYDNMEETFLRSGNRTPEPPFLLKDVKEKAKEKDEKVNNPHQTTYE
jgi:hypothetical protein